MGGVAALRAEHDTVQEGKRAFISRLTTAAQDWDYDLPLPEEPVSKKPR